MKTNNYLIMGLLVSFSLASCSNDETEAGTSASTAIEVSAGLADAETKAVINSGYDKKLDVMFGYLQGSGNSFTNWYNGTRMAGAGNQLVTFGEETLTYTSYANTQTKMVGIYPRPVVSGNVSSPIAYTIDGDMDLMATECQSADKDNLFKPFIFNHKLTQLQIKCVGATEAIKSWGDIKSIKVNDQPVNLRLNVLPANVETTLEINGSVTKQQLSFFNCPSKIVTAKEENPVIGYCMIYPEENLGTPSLPITLDVLTAYDGTNPDNPRQMNTAKKITINNIREGVKEGYAHLITLIFSSDGEIVIEADIAPWSPGSSTSTVVKPGN